MQQERRVPSAAGVVPTVRDRLQAALRSAATPFACDFACLLHPRRRLGEHGFGVITLAGESLALSVRMLEALSRVPLLLDGLTPVTVGPAEPLDWTVPGTVHPPVDEVLPVSRIALWPGAPRAANMGLRAFGNVLTAEQAGPQLVLFAASRPEGWPA